MIVFWLTVILSLVRDGQCANDPTKIVPEQFHLSFGEKLNDIVVTWSTLKKTSDARCYAFTNGEDKKQFNGTSTNFHEGRGQYIHRAILNDLKYNTRYVNGTSTIFHEGRGQYIHRAILNDLKFNTRYEYWCGSKEGFSKNYTFATPAEGNGASVKAVIYGDFGVVNAQTLPYLTKDIARGVYDFVLHVGDFAYNLDYENAHRGDKFMNMIEPFAATVPYMTVPGNHEEIGNFTHYKNRFTMPMREKYDSMFYSWNIGPVHFIGINSEAYYFFWAYGKGPLATQLKWLIQDLKEATKPENREKRPWIIMYGHRPMYCSNYVDAEVCRFERTRVGIDKKGKYRLEPLLKKYGVDVVIGAHEHSYERLWPVYDSKVYNGSKEHPYVNPRAPVHFITGAAGCQEKEDPFLKHPAHWSAFRSVDYGYTRFHAYNHSHIYFEQVSSDKKGAVIDSFWVVKEKHGPYDNI